MALEVYFRAVERLLLWPIGQRECLITSIAGCNIYTSIAIATGFSPRFDVSLRTGSRKRDQCLRAPAQVNGERLSRALTELRPSRISCHN